MRGYEELREESKFVFPVGQGQLWWRCFQSAPYHFQREHPPARLKSLYRDTRELDFYRQGEAGVIPRLTVRQREHSRTGCFLEYKLRLHRAHAKYRLRCDGPQPFWPLPVEFLWKFDVWPLFQKPLVMAEDLLYTACQREYLVSDLGIRLTLDTEVCTYWPHQNPGSARALGIEVLEIKHPWPASGNGLLLPEGFPLSTGLSKFRLAVEKLGLIHSL